MSARAQANGYSIGAAARAAGLSAKTIRYYEEIGLIPKAPRRAAGAHTGGDRAYSEADIGRLRFIRHARQVDLGLEDIRELLKIADAGCPSAGGECCTWETCGCIHAEPSTKQTEARVTQGGHGV